MFKNEKFEGMEDGQEYWYMMVWKSEGPMQMEMPICLVPEEAKEDLIKIYNAETNLHGGNKVLMCFNETESEWDIVEYEGVEYKFD